MPPTIAKTLLSWKVQFSTITAPALGFRFIVDAVLAEVAYEYVGKYCEHGLAHTGSKW